MGKTFEEGFQEIQIDMIDICMEYADYNAEVVYIYASYEAKVISCDWFYKVNGELCERHKLQHADTSVERQSACMDILNEDMEKLIALCEEFGKEMPTEIKLIYNAKAGNANADYKYELMYSNTEDKTADDMAEEWFAAEQSKAVQEAQNTDGVLHIAVIPYETGEKHYVYSRKLSPDGTEWIREGSFVEYYPDGTIASEGLYEDGLEEEENYD